MKRPESDTLFTSLDDALRTLEEALYWRGRDNLGWPMEGDDRIVDRARAAVRRYAECDDVQ